jgi:hypothetical protein
MNNDLIQKLMISKKIMDKHKEMPRGNAGADISYSAPMVEEFSAPNAKFNIPQEFISESNFQKPTSNAPVTKDRILGSKLPDEIKKLMIEHPISQPQSSGPVLSNELVEAASRLMRNESTSVEPKTKSVSPQIDTNELRKIVRETVEQVLSENGLLIESSSKSDETIKFQVGQHIFEGKITKIKKIK